MGATYRPYPDSVANQPPRAPARLDHGDASGNRHMPRAVEHCGPCRQSRCGGGRRIGDRHRLRITDIGESPVTTHEWRQIDVSSLDDVVDAADGMDAIINLSVLRPHRRIAFDVNTRGNYNMMVAAVTHGIQRVINTGPHYQMAGPGYEDWDFDLNPDMPPQSGTRLYAHTKALGQEIDRVFTTKHDIYLQTLLFYHTSWRFKEHLEANYYLFVQKELIYQEYLQEMLVL